ncbi:twin-arginine translocation signal domain-containing protein [Trichloromonas acetexigens]|uniref:Twin-arginine translocation signal domain-containing protein n=1 Tax=Trichloromonas acetexigens TaxID=38815 RepID=A0A550J406_9BACT|nr:twin-arginine translocation signal domain-containing protein [Desulfuromonas acetexigens]TRO77863.1 twin-arginine translocation signal domain-containing protein [Desulfuromonas acetexigens]
MTGRRSFLKGIIGAMAGCVCLVAPRPKPVAFPVLPDFASEPAGFELGWFQLEKTERGYVVPKLLATLTGGVVIVTRSSHPGRLAIYSQAAWFQFTEELRQVPTDVRSAVIRLVIAPAQEIDLRDTYSTFAGTHKK